jgi:3-hydroxyacyl-[acyl-carrier-protein] dehydratase
MENLETYLPHRPPFLFIDDVHLEGERILATRKFREDEWFFKGHFPSYPIVPGVLLVEAMAQAGGVGAKLIGIKPKSMFVFARIRTATFKRPVRPGDTLEMEIVNARSSDLALSQKGIGKVNGEIAVEAEWIAMASGVPE